MGAHEVDTRFFQVSSDGLLKDVDILGERKQSVWSKVLLDEVFRYPEDFYT